MPSGTRVGNCVNNGNSDREYGHLRTPAPGPTSDLDGFMEPAAMGMGARIDSAFAKRQNRRNIERNCGIIASRWSPTRQAVRR